MLAILRVSIVILACIAGTKAQCQTTLALACITDFNQSFGTEGTYCDTLNEKTVATGVDELESCMKGLIQSCGTVVQQQLMYQANQAALAWYDNIEDCYSEFCQDLSNCASPLVQNAISSPCASTAVIDEVSECMQNVTGLCRTRYMFYRAVQLYRQSCNSDCEGLSGRIQSALECHGIMEERYSNLLTALQTENVTQDDARCTAIVNSLECIQENVEGCYRATALVIILQAQWYPTIRKYCNTDTRFLCDLKDRDGTCRVSRPRGRKCKKSKKKKKKGKVRRKRWFWCNPCTFDCHRIMIRGCSTKPVYKFHRQCRKAASAKKKRAAAIWEKSKNNCLPVVPTIKMTLPFPEVTRAPEEQ